MLALLNNRTYRRLFFAQVIALLGTGFTSVALALLAYEMAGGNAGLVLGAAFALKMIAYVFIAPIVGGYAHHLPRRALLISLDLLRAALVLCLPFVTEIWQIYLLIFSLNACSAGFTPTFQATIPDVLPEPAHYNRALSLSRLAYDLENLLSPMLAGLALLVVGFSALFAVNALAFMVSAALVFSVALPQPKAPAQTGGFFQNTTFGLSAYLKTPRLRGLLALSFAVAAAGSMVIINTVVYVRGLFGGSQTDTALAFAAAGAGSMVVALMLPRLMTTTNLRGLMLLGAGILAGTLILGVFTPSFLILLPLWTLIGVGSSLIQTPAGRLIVTSSEPQNRPALFAAQFALSHACWLVTYPLAGWLGATFAPAVGFAVMGGGDADLAGGCHCFVAKRTIHGPAPSS